MGFLRTRSCLMIRDVSFTKKMHCYTLIEILINLSIIAVLSALIIPSLVSKYQNKSFQYAYNSQINSLENSFQMLPENENCRDITGTMMYAEVEPYDYSTTSGKYINKYMKVSKYCGNDLGDCFASKYYKYENHRKSEISTDEIKGACASLKHGVSICLKPMIKGSDYITGYLDLNGKSSPNILGRDLRYFEIKQNYVTNDIDESTSEVINTELP